MRAMMLCGAALMKQDERLPFLIAEFLTESTSMGYSADHQQYAAAAGYRRNGASG